MANSLYGFFRRILGRKPVTQPQDEPIVQLSMTTDERKRFIATMQENAFKMSNEIDMLKSRIRAAHKAEEEARLLARELTNEVYALYSRKDQIDKLIKSAQSFLDMPPND